jgi:hypothetical protein
MTSRAIAIDCASGPINGSFPKSPMQSRRPCKEGAEQARNVPVHNGCHFSQRSHALI